jgi:hypothetical protein
MYQESNQLYNNQVINMKPHYMIKKYLLLSLFIVYITGCGKEKIGPEQADGFIKFYGNSFLDTGKDVKQTTDGGYILVGTTQTMAGDNDILLIKTDRFGNREWETTFGGPGNDEGNGIQVTTDGGYILLGTYSDTLINETDAYLVKIKPATDGQIDWDRRILSSGNQSCSSIEVLSDGYVFTGTSDENGTDDILMVRTTLAGEILENNTSWYRAYSYGNEDRGTHIIKDPNQDQFIVVGTSDKSDAGQGQLNVILIVLSGNGSGIPNITLGQSGIDRGNSIRHLQGEEFVVCGTLDEGPNSRMFMTSITVTGENISKSPSGLVTFTESTRRSSGEQMWITTGNELAMIGSVLVSSGNWDIFLVISDASGVVQAQRTYGGSGNEFGFALQQTMDEGYIIVGSTGIPEDDNRLIALIKVDNEGEFE